MQQTLVLLFAICLNSCFGKTSKDLLSNQEAIDNFFKHKETLEQIRELTTYTSINEIAKTFDTLLDSNLWVIYGQKLEYLRIKQLA